MKFYVVLFLGILTVSTGASLVGFGLMFTAFGFDMSLNFMIGVPLLVIGGAIAYYNSKMEVSN